VQRSGPGTRWSAGPVRFPTFPIREGRPGFRVRGKARPARRSAWAAPPSRRVRDP
jgi:hypothetical protein